MHKIKLNCVWHTQNKRAKKKHEKIKYVGKYKEFRRTSGMYWIMNIIWKLKSMLQNAIKNQWKKKRAMPPCILEPIEWQKK